MAASSSCLGSLPPKYPALSEPAMLNSPMIAIDQLPTSGDSPHWTRIGGHVDVDEGEVEAADEEADHQQPIGAIAPGARQRLHEAQVGLARRVLGLAAQRIGERDHSDEEHREIDQRILPLERRDEALADGREDELAERRGGGGDAEDQRALLLRHVAAEGDHDDRERRRRDADAAHDARGEVEQDAP